MVSKLSAINKLKYQEEINFGRGLRAKANKDGTASWFFRMKMKGSRSPVYMKLGTHPDISLDEAEDKARIYRARITEGIHPKDYEEELIQIKRKKEAETKAASLTLRQLLADYERSNELFGRVQAESTIKGRRSSINLIWQEWLDLPIGAITKQVVLDKIDEWTSQRGSRGSVLRSCDYMSAMYNFAKTMDRIAENPFDIRKNRVPRKRKGQAANTKFYLQIGECKDLFKWLSILQSPLKNLEQIKNTFGDEGYLTTQRLQRQLQFDAIALTLLTGLRKTEILSLRWEQVYLSPDTWGTAKGPWFEFIKSKQQEPMGVPITPQMKPFFEHCFARKNAWVQRLKDDDQPIKPNIKQYLFPSIRTDKYITTTRKAYEQLNVAMPKLDKAPQGMGAQVLRKSFATCAYSLRYDFEQIGLYTGHTSAVNNPNVATGAYVARQADAHREGFSEINSAIVGDIHVDLVEIPDYTDEVDKQIKQFERLIRKGNVDPEMLAFLKEELINLKAIQKTGERSGKIDIDLLYSD